MQPITVLALLAIYRTATATVVGVAVAVAVLSRWRLACVPCIPGTSAQNSTPRLSEEACVGKWREEGELKAEAATLKKLWRPASCTVRLFIAAATARVRSDRPLVVVCVLVQRRVSEVLLQQCRYRNPSTLS